ncbi:MAG: amino acid permease [Ignavibacteriales bacterium]|nr:amino acid permease [Ignavibacteriales bacterium]
MENLEPKRQLNLVQTTSIIIGAVIGSGVFLNIPIVAKFGGSPGISVLIWLLGGVLWLPQIIILAEMGTAFPAQGGPYYYLYKAGSPFLAFLYTWTAFLTSDTPTITIIGLTASSVLTFFFPILGMPLYAKLFAAVLIFSLAYIQYRSVKTGSNFQIVLTTVKLLPLFAIVFIGFFYLNSGNLFLFPKGNISTKTNSVFNNFTAGVSATLWAYAGFINILYMAGEVKNPNKILPKSLMGSLLFVMIAYTLISLCTSAIVPFDKLVAAEGSFINPFVYLNFFAKYAGGFFAVAAFISMVGVLNSVIMTQPRLEYAMARDGLFFKIFGKLHPKYLTPHYSIFIQASLAVILFLLGDINTMLGYFTLSYVLQNALVYSAIFFLRKKPDYQPTYKVKFWFLMATLSIAIQLYIAWGTFIAYPTAGVLACVFLIGTGFPIYWYFYKRKPGVPCSPN